ASEVQSLITGTVVDEQGLPLPGVTLQIKGTTTGTTTDMEGEFSLDASEGDVLVVSFLGFETQEILLTDQRNVQITLAEDIAELNEVVVIGYGTVSKKDLTGSVSSLSTEDF